jgi:hypothetical protein
MKKSDFWVAVALAVGVILVAASRSCWHRVDDDTYSPPDNEPHHEGWFVYYGDVRMGTISVRAGVPKNAHILWNAKDVSVSFATFRLLAAGGALVTARLIFHLWRGQKFQIAIGHVFVLFATACHYAAVPGVVLGQATHGLQEDSKGRCGDGSY